MCLHQDFRYRRWVHLSRINEERPYAPQHNRDLLADSHPHSGPLAIWQRSHRANHCLDRSHQPLRTHQTRTNAQTRHCLQPPLRPGDAFSSPYTETTNHSKCRLPCVYLPLYHPDRHHYRERRQNYVEKLLLGRLDVRPNPPFLPLRLLAPV